MLSAGVTGVIKAAAGPPIACLNNLAVRVAATELLLAPLCKVSLLTEGEGTALAPRYIALIGEAPAVSPRTLKRDDSIRVTLTLSLLNTKARKQSITTPIFMEPVERQELDQIHLERTYVDFQVCEA